VRTTSLMVRGVVQVDVFNLQHTTHDADLTPRHVPDTCDACNTTCMKGTWRQTYSYATIPTAPASVLLRRDPPGWSSNHLQRPDASARRRTTDVSGHSRGPRRRGSAAPGIARTMLLLAAHPAPRACACSTVPWRALPPCWVPLHSRPALVLAPAPSWTCACDFVRTAATAIAGSLHS
jgi:hypothetical protein